MRLDATQPLRLRFDAGAQQLFEAWHTELETKYLHSSDLHPALVSHLAKYPSLMPSLALLFELADGGKEAVSLAHAQQAVAFCDYLRGHAARIYSLAAPPKLTAAVELSRHLSAGWRHAEGKFAIRDVYRNGWRGLSAPEEVVAALDILEDAGWVKLAKWERKESGRSTRLYLINPKIQVK